MFILYTRVLVRVALACTAKASEGASDDMPAEVDLTSDAEDLLGGIQGGIYNKIIIHNIYIYICIIVLGRVE